MDAIEQQLRRELAAAYRLIACFGWDNHVATHLSARLPDGSFLINRYGQLFEEVTAANLARVAMDGTLVSPSSARLNPAGINIHAGLLEARPEVGAVMHLHTPDGVAVSAQAHGVLPLSQTAMLILPDIAYHAFEGIADKRQERESLARDLGQKNLLVLRNHGTLTVGATIADAFYRLYALEWSCTAQIKALAGSPSLTMPSPEVVKNVGNAIDWASPTRFSISTFWPTMLRRAERLCPGFDNPS